MKALGFVIAFALGNFAFANNNAELPTKKITVEIKKAGVRSALQALFDNSGSKFSLADEITNDLKVDVEAVKQKWSDVFANVLKQAGLRYNVANDGTIEVSMESSDAESAVKAETQASDPTIDQ